jgi:spermidine synthase
VTPPTPRVASLPDARRRGPLVTAFPYVTALMAGFATMAFEMLLGRALVPYFGGTIYTWGALITIFLLGMTGGYFVGGILSDRFRPLVAIPTILVLSATFMAATPLFLEPVCRYLVEHVEEIQIGAIAGSAIFALVPAALFASVSPFCLKLRLEAIESAGSLAGVLSALNAFGSIVGTVGTSFLLIPSFGTRAIFVALAAVTMLLAATGMLAARRAAATAASRRRASRAAALGLCALALGLAPAGAPAAASEQVLESVESEYNNIFVTRRGPLRFMTFGYRGSQYVESVWDPSRPDELVVDYTRYMTLALLYPSALEQAAFIGLGGGRTAGYLVRTVPSLSLEVAELDGQVIRLAKQYFGVQTGPRLSIAQADGRVFLTRSKKRYDLVFLDAYRGPFVPFHLLTKEFFQLVKSRLKPDGVVVQNVEPSTMVLDSAYRTIGAVFANVDYYEAAGNAVLVGYNGRPLSQDELNARAVRFAKTHRPLYPPATLLTSRRSFTPSTSAKVLTDDFAPVEMLRTIKRHNEKRQ